MHGDPEANKVPSDKIKFRAVLPDFPEGQPVTGAEAEAHFLERIESSGGTDIHAIYQLSAIYSRSGRLEEAEECVRRMLEANQSPGEAAVHLLQLGQIAEKRNDYEAAATFYEKGMDAGPVHPEVCYFLRNNLGYSLVRLNCYDEADPLLRDAIELDPLKPNAHKNLALSLWGRGRFVEAAHSFIESTRVNAADGRSLKHLEGLYRRHPEIADEIQDFEALLESCRNAVAEAARHRPDLKAWWKRDRKDAESKSKP
jgi:pentatricopeptide repeat protein